MAQAKAATQDAKAAMQQAKSAMAHAITIQIQRCCNSRFNMLTVEIWLLNLAFIGNQMTYLTFFKAQVTLATGLKCQQPKIGNEEP